jgi:hypothetical protein
VFATKHLLRLPGLDLCFEFVERAREILSDRLPRFGPFREDVQVVDSLIERRRQLAILLEPPAALEQFLSGRLILPEVRSRQALFYPCKFVGRLGGVKDGSAGQRRGGPVPDVCGAARLGVRPWGSGSTGQRVNGTKLAFYRTRRVARNTAAVNARDNQATRSPIRL